MARRRKRSKATWKVQLDKMDKKVGLLLLIIVGLVIGVSSGPWATFGESSDWGADVEIMSIGYGTNVYDNMDNLPTRADVLLAGSRAITVDYDGMVDELIQPEVDIGGYIFNDVPTSTVGMYPRVTHAVGNFFYTNEIGERSLAPVRTFENTTDNLANIHYYFGFSVMFTSRAEVQFADTNVLMYQRDSGEYNWAGKQLAPIRPIDLSTTVGIRVQSLTDTFDYEGFINSVTVINERARYTISESITGTSQDLDDFNTGYDWLDLNMKGSASGQMPLVSYNVIDSETEKLATIALKAHLEIGVDSAVTSLPTYITQLNTALNPEGYTLTGTHNVYNVEYIYDVMVDLSINGVPIADAMGDWAEGTNDGTFPADEPEEMNWIFLIAVALIAVIAVTVIMKRS